MLLNAAGRGSTVYLPSGDYLFRSNVWVPEGVTLLDAPASRLITDDRSRGGAFLAVAGNDVTLSHLVLAGNRRAGVGIDATDVPVRRLTVRHCTVGQLQAAGIQVGHESTLCTDVRIADNVVIESPFPISLLLNCERARITGNVVTSSPHAAPCSTRSMPPPGRAPW